MTFYAEMAAAVVELLEEFGGDIEIVRNGAVFNDVTNTVTSGGNVSHTTTGVVLHIGAAVVNGTRIQSGERAVILAPTFAPIMGDKMMLTATSPTTTGAAPGSVLSLGLPGAWTISDIETIKPAGTVLAYRVRCSR